MVSVHHPGTLCTPEFLALLSGDLRDDWFVEGLSDNRVSAYKIREHLYKTETKHHKLELLDLAELGRVLVLDGRIQMAETDEHIYHEMLVHPAVVMASGTALPPRDGEALAPKTKINALVLGGGDGCVAREILKWKSVERVKVVAVDEGVVEVFRDRVPEWNNKALSDPRVEVVIGDTTEALEDGETWDVIFGAEANPVPYEKAKAKLRSGGVYAVHAGGVRYVPEYDKHHVALVHDFVDTFDHAMVGMEFIRSFDALWSVAFGMSNVHFPFGTDMHVAIKLQQHGMIDNLRYYSPSTHARLFAQVTPQIYTR